MFYWHQMNLSENLTTLHSFSFFFCTTNIFYWNIHIRHEPSQLTEMKESKYKNKSK